MNQIKADKYRTWIEISKSAVKNNYQAFRKIIKPQTSLLGVVKSNAYGHGLVGFAKILDQLGTDWLGVDSITEADNLRRNGIKQPILAMGYTLPQNFAIAARQKIALTISTFPNLKFLIKKKFQIPIHIKVETGLNRQGFLLEDLGKVISILKKADQKNVDGLYTHFAKAYYPGDESFTKKQIQKYKQAVSVFHKAGFRPILHAAATGGTLNFPEAHFDMVRVGIGLYGLWPTEETRQVYKNRVRLTPVLSWKTRITEIKTALKGETVGYYRAEKLKRNSKLAVLPIGYWHGFDRRFSSIGHVLVHGRKAKVVGRVSMDMTVIDVTAILNTKAGDEVIIIGRNGRNQVVADDLAKIAKTINYEIVTRINPLIERFYI